MKTSATRRCTAGAGTIPVVTTPAGLPCAAPGTSTRLVWGPVLRRDDVRVHQPRTTEWRLADPRRPGASRHPSPPRPPPVNRDPDSRVRRPAPPVPPTTLGRDPGACLPYGGHPGRGRLDRKSTRLNSSHVKSSYAVFCLKKKKKLSGEQSYDLPE